MLSTAVNYKLQLFLTAQGFYKLPLCGGHKYAKYIQKLELLIDFVCARFEVLTAVLVHIQDLWDVTPYLVINGYRSVSLLGRLDPEGEGRKILRNGV
jgi:hypothetical protein